MRYRSAEAIAYQADYIALFRRDTGLEHGQASKWVSEQGSYHDYVKRGGKLSDPYRCALSQQDRDLFAFFVANPINF